MAEDGRTRRVCGRLGQNEPYGVTDVCGEPAGHQTAGEGTPHVGRYHGMKWLDRPEYGQGKIRILDPGDVMGAATREELPHQRRPAKAAPKTHEGFSVGKRRKRPHHPEGWHPTRGEGVPFSQAEADAYAERRRRRTQG